MTGLPATGRGEAHEAPGQRLTAILAADAVGYSRLMAADEQSTLAALERARVVFREQAMGHDGRIVDTAGDSVLAVFGTASGALRAALRIQQQIASVGAGAPQASRMLFRVGVHLGDVITQADGSVYGDGVNIAARLQAMAEPGGVVVSDAVRSAVRDKVPAHFEDRGDQQVKNIPGTVRVFAVCDESGVAHPVPREPAAVETLKLPDKPSIAVLPFANMSGDAEQEFFCDGVTEDIITELSRFRSLFVIARNSTFTYKAKAVDVRTVARELGVRYVLDGSIRRAGQRIRVAAQLVDAATGEHVWAERYDRQLAELFDLQEELTRAIVGAIAPQIEKHEFERTRTRRPDNLSAHEIGMRAWALTQLALRQGDPAARDDAIRTARQALAIDPRCTIAFRTIAAAQWHHLNQGTTDTPQAARDEAMAAAMNALTLDGADHTAYLTKGALLCAFYGEAEKAAGLADIRHAHELNPSDARCLSLLGFFEAMSGDAAAALEHTATALRLSPCGTERYLVLNSQAWAHFTVEDYARAAQVARDCLGEAPSYYMAQLCLTVSLAGLGEWAQARAACEQLGVIAPHVLRARLAGRWLYRDRERADHATRLLRIAAGLDDHATGPPTTRVGPVPEEED